MWGFWLVVLFLGLCFSVDFFVCLFFCGVFLGYSWKKIRRYFCSYCWWIRLWKKITQIEAEALKPTLSCAEPKIKSLRCKMFHRQQSRTCGYDNSADRDLGVLPFPLLATLWYISSLEFSLSEVQDASTTCLSAHSNSWPSILPQKQSCHVCFLLYLKGPVSKVH